MDRLEHCCRFFLNSPKRSGILELIVTDNFPDSPGRKPLLDLCRTCWAERHSAYQHFYQAYSFIVQALELIGYRLHLDKYADWNTVNHTEAQQILASLTLFACIVSFTCMYQYLSHLTGITVKLQKRSLDTTDAHELIAEVTATYEGKRKDVNIHTQDVTGSVQAICRRTLTLGYRSLSQSLMAAAGVYSAEVPQAFQNTVLSTSSALSRLAQGWACHPCTFQLFFPYINFS